MIKNVLITGGCGYIGSHISALFQQHGYHVVVVDNFSTGSKNNKLSGIDYLEGDIGNTHFINSVFRQYIFDLVIHLAAKTSIEESNARPDLYYAENTNNTMALILACKEHHVKNFIFSSTASVYCKNSRAKVDESSRIKPASPYGKSKYSAELILRDIAQQYNINCIIFRYFNVSGRSRKLSADPCQKYPLSLIQSISSNFLSGNPLIINGNDYETADGTCIRDYVHVMDIANAHLNAIAYLSKTTEVVNDVFNIGYGIGTSVLNIYNKFKELVSDEIEYSVGPRRENDIVYSIADSTKVQEKMGWKSMYKNALNEIILSDFLWQKSLFNSNN